MLPKQGILKTQGLQAKKGSKKACVVRRNVIQGTTSDTDKFDDGNAHLSLATFRNPAIIQLKPSSAEMSKKILEITNKKPTGISSNVLKSSSTFDGWCDETTKRSPEPSIKKSSRIALKLRSSSSSSDLFGDENTNIVPEASCKISRTSAIARCSRRCIDKPRSKYRQASSSPKKSADDTSVRASKKTPKTSIKIDTKTCSKICLAQPNKKRRGARLPSDSCDYAEAKDIPGKEDQWRAGENLCMLFAIYKSLDEDQKKLVTMDGTEDVRDVFKAAVGCQGKNFVRGTTSTDVHTFFRHVSKMHYQQSGIYVFFGSTRKNNVSHKAQLKTIIAKTCDDERIMRWSKGKSTRNDHAISVVIDDKMEGYIFDNGCVNGERRFSILNIATRMRWMNQCFVMDLYVV